MARLADIPAAVRRLGTLAGTGAAADRAAATMEARLGALTATYGARAGSAPERAAAGLEPSHLHRRRQAPDERCARHLCGARNVFADLPEAGPIVDMESIIGRDPDIIVAAAPAGEGAVWVADWMQLKSLSAVRNQRVVAFEDQALSRLGPSVIGATENLCRTLASVSRGNY